MTKLVETIAKSLVDHPDQVVVTEEPDNQGSVLQLQVAGSDMGKVIGKQGRIAKALRTVVKAAATKQKKKVIVEIVSEEELAQAAREDQENHEAEPETAPAEFSEESAQEISEEEDAE